ncbi:hypothetical protein [Bacillus sp. SJS]|uniref:hypothetical protein n=1 Tax=Bacillus sp. SJS TaxID=1423321 RepID=UPI0004DCED13|nr:hypothetical protein [Bacillus sp. SJS]KZZ85453.1 hypothetical protein AS29_005795 [Bacillus sp. SJS]
MEFKYKENGEMGVFTIAAGAIPLAIPFMILSAIGWDWHSLSNFSYFLFLSFPLIGLGIYSLTMKKRNYLVIRRDMLYLRNVFRMKKSASAI